MEVCPAFIDETGVLSESANRQPIFGIGVLVVPETKVITESFYRLHFNFVQERARKRNEFRKQLQDRDATLSLAEIERLMWSSRHHEYKFAEVTHFNIQDYVDLINLYFSFPDLEFHSTIFNRLDPKASLARWDNDTWLTYTSVTKDLLEKRVTRDVFAIVDLQSKPDQSAVHLEDVLCSVSTVKGCLRATSDMSIYLQLVDLLLGCVQYDIKESIGYYDPSSKRAKAKGQLANFLKTKLGIRREDRFLSGGQSFEWKTHSTFTVTEGEW